jgi:hypothetical protein
MNMSGVMPAEPRRFFYAWGLAVLGATALIPPLTLSADWVRAEQQTANVEAPTATLGDASAPIATSPYTIRVIKQAEGKFKLRGQVASKEDHKAVLGLVKASYPSADVTDRIKVGGGQKADMKLGNISFALKALGYLQSGASAKIDEQGIALTGQTESRAAYDEFQGLLEQGRPAGIVVQDEIVQPQTAFSWRAELGEGTVTLTGSVPAMADKEELKQIVGKMFADRKIDDYTAVAGGAPDSWLDAAMHSLRVLRLLNSGFVLVADHSIRVDGQAPNGEKLETIADLADRYPVGFALESKVSVPSAAEPARASMFGFGFPQASVAAHQPAAIDGAIVDDGDFSAGTAAAAR